MRILIANRGEIARRVIRTAKRLGHETVAVFADPDATAPFVADADHAVRIGPASLAESYLSSERSSLPALTPAPTPCTPAMAFSPRTPTSPRPSSTPVWSGSGPSPSAIATMGSKIEARRLAAEAGCRSSRASLTPRSQMISRRRRTHRVPRACEGCCRWRREGHPHRRDAGPLRPRPQRGGHRSQRSFGDGRVIVERYITPPRHVEVQVVGDKHGTIIELGTRDAPCSAATKAGRRAPAPNLPDSTETGLRTAALRLAESSATTRRARSSSLSMTRPATTSSSR